MRVDVVGKDHLFLLRHALAEIDADVPVAAARSRELDAHVMIARERHEVRGVAPEFLELEGLAVRQLHHQRRVDVVEKALHRVAHEDRRMLQHRRAVPSAMAREDELVKTILFFPESQRPINKPAQGKRGTSAALGPRQNQSASPNGAEQMPTPTIAVQSQT